MPHPPSSQRGGESRDKKLEGRRGPRGNQFFVFLQSQRKSARNLDGCLSRCPGPRKGFVEGRDTLSLPRASLLRGGPHVSSTPRCLSRSPGRRAGGLGGRVRASSPPPPPGRPSPGRGRGLCPARGTRRASGHGTPPPHPPCRGHVGARPEAPPALLHVGGGSRPSLAWRLRPPKAKEPALQTVSSDTEHAAPPSVQPGVFNPNPAIQSPFPTAEA